MAQERDSLLAMLTSKDERMQSYLRTTNSPDDIVHSVTTAFAGDVARIMAKAGSEPAAARAVPRVAAKSKKQPAGRRR